MRAVVIIVLLLATSACSPGQVAVAYDARAEAARPSKCVTEKCKPGEVRDFASLSPLYKAYLLLIYPFWSV